MARYIRSLHHGGAKGMQHREHRSKKNRNPRHKFSGRNPFFVERSNASAEQEEKFWDVVFWKRKSKKKP